MASLETQEQVLKSLLNSHGNQTDTAITDPTLSASEIAVLKGLLKQLQGTGTGAAPVTLNGRIPKYWPDNTIMFDDDFSQGFQGWVPNFAGPANGGMWGTLSLSTTSMTGPYSLQLATADGKGSTEPWGNCAAIKRMTTPRVTGIYNFECWVDIGSQNFDTCPAFFLMGIDHQKRDPALQMRRFFQIRWNNYDGTIKRRLEIYTDTGWQAIPGADMILPWNENKVTFVYFRLAVDIGSMSFVEAQVYDRIFDLSGFKPYADVYHYAFDGGLNVMVQLVNYPGAPGWATARIDRARGYFS